MSDYPDTDEYEVELDSGEVVQVVELADEVELSSSKRIQLERFEPIEEETSIGASIPGYSGRERLAIIESLSKLTCDICERNLTRRYEAHVRAEAFGDE